MIEGRGGETLAGVVLAAGRSERFGTPKQYALLGGERLIDRAVRLVQRFTAIVVVALPEHHVWDGAPVHAVVEGGATRTESMRRAMAAVPEEAEFVLVTDVIRPLASARLVRDLLDAVAAGADGAIPVWKPPDTIKTWHEDGRISHAGREGFAISQSPTALRTAALRRMFEELDEVPIEETIGIERIGGRIVGVSGDRWSHHVVEPRDLALMERLLDLIDD